MVTQSEMLRCLTALSLHFPQASRSPEELMIIARDWTEDLEGFSPQAVNQAVKLAIRELNFFPTTRQMIELCSRAQGDVDRLQARNALPAPEPKFEDVCELGKRRIAEIKARLEKVVTA